MFSTRLYVRILSYVILIVLAATSGFAGIISGRAVILGTVALCTAAWLIGALVHYLNAYNRKIRLFLDSIADNESTLYFQSMQPTANSAICMPRSTGYTH